MAVVSNDKLNYYAIFIIAIITSIAAAILFSLCNRISKTRAPRTRQTPNSNEISVF